MDPRRSILLRLSFPSSPGPPALYSDQFERRTNPDGSLKRASDGTVPRVDVVNPFNRLPLVRRRSELIAYVNASDHKHVSLELNFSDCFRTKPVIAGVDLARLQRASECPGESTGGRGNDIIQGCGMRWISIRGNLVMLSDLGMNAEDDRLFLCG